MKVRFILLFTCFLLGCENDDNPKFYGGEFAGTYYCKRIDINVNYHDSVYVYVYKDSLSIDSVKIPKLEYKTSLDTIEVVSIGDSTLRIDGMFFRFYHEYYFYDDVHAHGAYYSGNFIGDSLYLNFSSIFGSGYHIIGKRK